MPSSLGTAKLEMTGTQAPLEPARQAGQPILDRLTFEQFTAAHRRELKLHCYRMMGSLHEADDLVQDTLLRAWRARSEFDGRGSVRGWLTMIATNSLPQRPQGADPGASVSPGAGTAALPWAGHGRGDGRGDLGGALPRCGASGSR